MAAPARDGLTGPSVFKDLAVLDYDWVPPKLLHRDDETSRLGHLFAGVLDGTTSQRAFITGPVGTGKTALAKRFAADLGEHGRAKGHPVESVWVNCRRNAAEGTVMLRLLEHFDRNYPQRGYGTQEMLRDLRKHIDRRGIHLLVVLDEADALVRKTSDLVYNLSRFDDERPIRKATLSLILVSARDDLVAMLDDATRSTVKRTNTLVLPRYSADQLADILRARVPLAFHKGTLEDDVVDLIADIAAEDGDARYAIELLEGAGRAANEEGVERVEAEHVRAVKAHTRSVVSEAKLGLLQPHPLFVLLAAARKLQRSRKPYVTTGELEEQYALVAEEYGERARAHTQFWKYLKELQTADWLELKKTQGGAEGQTQRIALHDLPADVLAQKIEGILEDRRDTAAA